jgi:hypothetical protein
MDRGEGGVKSVLVAGIVILGTLLGLAQLCFWAAHTLAPGAPVQAALEKGCHS